MLDKKELLEAISYCEEHVSELKDCAILASLYTIYDHKFAKKNVGEPICELIIQVEPKSEFLSAVNGKQSCEVWNVMDGLMQYLADNNPVLYEDIMDKILH